MARVLADLRSVVRERAIDLAEIAGFEQAQRFGRAVEASAHQVEIGEPHLVEPTVADPFGEERLEALPLHEQIGPRAGRRFVGILDHSCSSRSGSSRLSASLAPAQSPSLYRSRTSE